jgi:hypothetical protein
MDKDHLEIILESIDNKFQLVLEGHSSLANQIAELRQETNERFDLVDFKFQVLNDKIDTVAADLKATDKKLTKKIDAVSADLKAHRADTEAHSGKGLYVVREG